MSLTRDCAYITKQRGCFEGGVPLAMNNMECCCAKPSKLETIELNFILKGDIMKRGIFNPRSIDLLVFLACIAICFGSAPLADASVTTLTTHGSDNTSLDAQIISADLISGQIATELAGDTGWHPANTNPADQLPAFTDDTGVLASGLTGLLNDFPTAGQPTKLIQYDFGAAMDIAGIQILSGNAGKDGRIFSTTVINYSTDGISFSLLGYFQSDPSGTVNAGQWGSTLVEIFDDSSPTLLTGIQALQFNFYSVDNTAGQMRDPFDGVNPFTGIDDGLTAAFVSPLIYEIDVIGAASPTIPEPTSLFLLCTGLCTLGWSANRRKKV